MAVGADLSRPPPIYRPKERSKILRLFCETTSLYTNTIPQGRVISTAQEDSFSAVLSYRKLKASPSFHVKLEHTKKGHCCFLSTMAPLLFMCASVKHATLKKP